MIILNAFPLVPPLLIYSNLPIKMNIPKISNIQPSILIILVF